MPKQMSPKDLEFVDSLGAAILEQTPKRMRMVFWFWSVAVAGLLVWMNFAEIDEIARGHGEVVPSGENQIVQNLEGGIVEEILVHEGSVVEKGDILLKIDNQKSESSYESNELSSNALEVKMLRLKAQSEGTSFVLPQKLREKAPRLIRNEEHLYASSQEQLQTRLEILSQQKIQKKSELLEAKSKLKHLHDNLSFLHEEMQMTAPLVKKGVKSRVDYLKLQRQESDISKEYDATKILIPRLQSSIIELKQKVKELEYAYKIEANTELNEVLSKLERTRSNANALGDEVRRTVVRSPMKGIVQALNIHTIGGVIKPGEDLIEIVPIGKNLLVEVKIKPSDIAFIYPGQEAKVKFSAYDFSIYGGLGGKVISISPDSITDEKGETFYTVQIQTSKNYLGTQSKPLKIIPGMVSDVDIITGKKSILDYVLKPILKTKQYTFSER